MNIERLKEIVNHLTNEKYTPLEKMTEEEVREVIITLYEIKNINDFLIKVMEEKNN